MNPEQPNLEREFKAENILHLIEYALIASHKANEGNKGVILEFDLSKLSQEDLHLFLPPDVVDNQEILAAKVLKIYTPGNISSEAKMQERAYNVVSDQANGDLPLAKIPRVYYNNEISLNNVELSHYLESCGVNTVGGKVGVMLMDYVGGEDLATHLYKYLINHDSRLADVRARLDNAEEDFNFANIERRIANALAYQEPSAQASEAERFRVEAANSRRLFAALKKHGFTLDKEVIIKLQNTLRLLHDNNIYHNDLHKRNVMFSLDENGQIDDVYIIDFGLAADTQDKDGLAFDFDIVDTYRDFVDSEASAEDKSWLNEIDRLKQRLDKIQNPAKLKEWHDFQHKIRDIMATGGPSMLQYLDNEIYLGCSKLMGGSEDWLKLAASLILDIAKDHQDLARQLTQLNISKPANPYTENFWRNLLKQL